VPRQRDQQRHRVLGGGDVVAAGGVHDGDAAGGGGTHVDVVDADARPPDHPQGLGGRDHVGAHLGSAPDHQTVGVGDLLEQRVRVEARLVDGVEPSCALEDLEALGGKGVADEDLGHGALSSGARGGLAGSA
jgi:hypothetical protein